MSPEQQSWQDAYRAQRTPEEAAADAKRQAATKRWIWGAAIVLLLWIGVVLLGFTVWSPS